MRLTFSFTRDGADHFGAEVPSLSVFVFDEQGLFAGRWDETDNSKFGADYTMNLPLAPGTYSFVAWGGLVDPNYYLSSPNAGVDSRLDPVVGETTLEELILCIAHQVRNSYDSPQNYVDYVPGALFFGHTAQLTIEANKEQSHEIPLLKYTNTIYLTVIGLPDSGVMTRANAYSHFDVTIQSPNCTYDFNGQLTTDRVPLTYVQHDAADSGPLTQSSSFHTMRLVLGNQYMLRFYNTETGENYYSARLLEDIISKVKDGSGQFPYDTQEELNGEDVYHIELDLRPEMGVTIKVNGWTINSYGGDIE
jgi:hypothetical protein